MMEVHPFADTIPKMTPTKFAALKKSIADDGQKEPITRYRGQLLDGRHRVRALTDLGIPESEWLIRDFDGTDEQAGILVRCLNLDRNNPTPDEERTARAALVREMHAKGMSQRAIAEAVGVHQKTVWKDINGQVTPPASPVGTPKGEGDGATATKCDSAGLVHPALTGVPDAPARPQPVVLGCPLPTGTSVRDSDTRTADTTPPRRVTGRDGKQYAATRPQPKPASKPADQEPEAEAAPVIRSVALGKAQEAINIMMTIPPGDAQRARAFEMITSWIKLNATRQR